MDSDRVEEKEEIVEIEHARKLKYRKGRLEKSAAVLRLEEKRMQKIATSHLKACMEGSRTFEN